MKTIIQTITATFAILMMTTMTTATLAKPEPKAISEPCLVDGECDVIRDANLDWSDQEGQVIENKMFINPTFSGKLTALELKNVVFLNGKLGAVDLSAGTVLNKVVFRGNQMTSLNFGGARLSKVIVEGNLKQPPQMYGTEEQLAEPIPLNLRNAIVRDSIFVNNVILIKGNKNTVIYRTSFTRNNMMGSKMQDVKVERSDFVGNDARDSDLRFGSASDVEIVNNQVHGVHYPKGRGIRVSIHGNWANNPLKEGRVRVRKAS